MTYKKMLRQLALKENVSVKEIESEMQSAIKYAGLDCSIKEFIEITTKLIKEKTIYNNIV